MPIETARLSLVEFVKQLHREIITRCPLSWEAMSMRAKGVMPIIRSRLRIALVNLIDVLDGNQTLDDVLPTQFDKDLYQVTGYYGSRNWRAKFVDARAQTLKGEQDNVYAYLFKWGGPGSGPTPFDFIYGAGHAMEISFFFGNDTSLWGYSFSPENDTAGRMVLRDAMMAYVANFARTGDPNGAGLVQWDEWSNTEGQSKTIVFDSDLDNALISMRTEEVTIPGVSEALTAELATWDEKYGEGTYAAWGWVPWSFQLYTAEPLTCQLLTSLDLPDVAINSAEEVEASDALPGYCLVYGSIEGNITFEVKLPAAGGKWIDPNMLWW